MFQGLLPALVFLISYVNALESFNMYVSSDHQAANSQNLQFLYEGESGSYVFLTSGVPPVLIYDDDNNTITFSNNGDNQLLYINGSFVTFTTQSVQTQNFTFIDDKLAVDGQTDNFYACLNVNDPQEYSQVTHEIMYFTDNVPKDCAKVDLVRNFIISTFSNFPSATTTSSSSKRSISPTQVQSSSSILTSTAETSLLSSSPAESSLSTSSKTSSSYRGASTYSETTSAPSSTVSVVSTRTSNFAAGDNIPKLPLIGLFVAVGGALI